MAYYNILHCHSILGMKWVIRRYQNADRSLISVGRKKYELKERFIANAVKDDKRSGLKYKKGG